MTCLPILPGISIRLIKQIVARRYKIPIEAMTSADRRREFAHPRQMAMALAREYTRKSLPTIGRYFGGRDHTTVMYACEAVQRRAAEREDIARDLSALRAILDQIAPKPAEVNMPDLYAELGLTPGATPEEIKAAHRRKVREHHPDRGGDLDEFVRLQAAYDALRNAA